MDKLKEIMKYLAVVFLAIALVVFIILSPKPTGQTYDCSLSEISPDYPIKVKEECRKLRAEKFNKDLQKPK